MLLLLVAPSAYASAIASSLRWSRTAAIQPHPALQLRPAVLRQLRTRPVLAVLTDSSTSTAAEDVLTKRLAEEAPGTLLGATALVAGTTVGAGVLALPAKTLAAGFVPSSGVLFLAWCYMAASGLLIAEVNVNTLCSLERDAVSITSMAEETIGEAGSRLCGVAYVFIHYALLVAYMLQGGKLLLELLPSAAALPPALGAPLFAASVGLPIALGSQQLVERVNSLLVGGVVATFGALLLLGAPQVPPASTTAPTSRRTSPPISPRPRRAGAARAARLR